MIIIRKAFWLCLLSCFAIFLAGVVSPVAAQTERWNFSPCGAEINWYTPAPEFWELLERGHLDKSESPIATHGLSEIADEGIVYDSNQGVCWMANANLAANEEIREKLGVTGINPDGTMDYPTAVNWVHALNNFDNGRGYLGHNNWQLPDTPLNDSTCSSNNNGSFGASCTGSALGSLYYVGLTRKFPDSVVADFDNEVPPFRNLQPALYWTSDVNSGGQVTFSFNTNLNGANTTKYNYFHVLPMALGSIGTPMAGSGVVVYTNAAAAGKAVYDTKTGITWVLDANLAAAENFGITGTTSISSTVNNSTLTVPLIDVDGAILFSTVGGPGSWLAAMNKDHYAGTNNWMLPSLLDLQNLYNDLNLQAGDRRLEAEGHVGPFRHLQPGFYWACERNPMGSSQSPCNPNLNPSISPNGTPFDYSFNFDNGFEGTDLQNKQFYVMVYFPAPAHCDGPEQGCRDGDHDAPRH